MRNILFISILCVAALWLGCDNSDSPLTTASFSTDQDIASNGKSRLSVKNTGTEKTLTGLYIYGLAWSDPTTPGCDVDTVGASNYVQYAGMAGGMATPVLFEESASLPIGKNYLYNMMMSYFYWYNHGRGGSASPCVLPGCSWSTDTIKYKWCVKVNGIYPKEPTSSPDAAVIPFAWPSVNMSPVYDYEVLSDSEDFVWIGPFTCNDKTLTCTASSAHEQPF